MANISEADVRFEAHGCYKELKKYIETTNKFEYGLGNNGVLDGDVKPDNSGSLTCYGCGRWDYMRNLEYWFEEMNDEVERSANRSAATYSVKMYEAMIAFNSLKIALKENGGYIEISYCDIEPGCAYLASGNLKIVMGKNNYLELDEVDLRTIDYTAQNIVEFGFAESVEHAKEDYGA